MIVITGDWTVDGVRRISAQLVDREPRRRRPDVVLAEIAGLVVSVRALPADILREVKQCLLEG